MMMMMMMMITTTMMLVMVKYNSCSIFINFFSAVLPYMVNEDVYNSNGIEYLMMDDGGWNMDETGLDTM